MKYALFLQQQKNSERNSFVCIHVKSPIQYVHGNYLLSKPSRLIPPLLITMQDFIIAFTSLIPEFET